MKGKGAFAMTAAELVETLQESTGGMAERVSTSVEVTEELIRRVQWLLYDERHAIDPPRARCDRALKAVASVEKLLAPLGSKQVLETLAQIREDVTAVRDAIRKVGEASGSQVYREQEARGREAGSDVPAS